VANAPADVKGIRAVEKRAVLQAVNPEAAAIKTAPKAIRGFARFLSTR
jgi:hypothetical protein